MKESVHLVNHIEIYFENGSRTTLEVTQATTDNILDALSKSEEWITIWKSRSGISINLKKINRIEWQEIDVFV